MARPRGLNTYLRVVSRLRRLTDPTPDPVSASPKADAAAQDVLPPARPAGILIWVQASEAADARWVDVFAESLSDERGEDITLLLTTEKMSDPSVGPDVLRQITPSESGRKVDQFLAHWKPDLGIFLNAPNRPVLITKADDAGIPLFLAATRRAQTMVRPRVPILNAALLDCFKRGLAASATDGEALRRQGMPAEKVEVTGPLTDISTPLSCDLEAHDKLRGALSGRPVWMAVDTTPEDLQLVADAQRGARRASHRLLAIIIPRDDDPAKTRAQLAADGWQMNAGDGIDGIDESSQIVVGTREDRALWYRVAPITLVGGTFEDDATSADPFEAALLGSAVIHGPATAPYEGRFQRLNSGGGALPLTDTDEIQSAIEYLLAPDRTAEFAHAGWSVTSEAAPVVDRLVALTNEALDQVRD